MTGGITITENKDLKTEKIGDLTGEMTAWFILSQLRCNRTPQKIRKKKLCLNYYKCFSYYLPVDWKF